MSDADVCAYNLVVQGVVNDGCMTDAAVLHIETAGPSAAAINGHDSRAMDSL
jgi:hypothetical protein